MKQCYRIFIHGMVQGVFFRQSTQQQAQRYGLSGWVRNRLDGRVEVLLYGESPAVKSMLKWLEIGPKQAKVTKIEYREIPVDTLNEPLPAIFEVRATV